MSGIREKKRSTGIFFTAILLCAAMTYITAADAYASEINGCFEGKDGWYFLTRDSTIQDYQGANLFTPEQLQIIKANFTNMRDTLEANGKEFVIFLIPNKEHIYSEYMPDEYGELATYTRIQQVYDLLKDDFRIIYPEQMLREAKEKYPYELYPRTDPHWNWIGTYLCSKLLMEELGYEMPELEDLTIFSYETDELDCAYIRGEKLPDIAYAVSGYENQGKSDARILICGDSFSLEFSNCISPIVDNCFIVHRDYYYPSLPYETQSTIVVYEIVERFMDVMPYFSCV